MSNSYYTKEELYCLGFNSLGENVLISRKCSIYSPEKFSIGNNVRIDDFCVLSGKITIGNYVHIASHNRIFAGDVGIVFEDYSAISSNCSVYALTDDYSGDFFVGPCYPDALRNVISKQILIKKYAAIGTSCVILPGATVEEGVVLCAMSMLIRKTKPWHKYMGIPAVCIGERNKKVIDLEKKIR